MDFGWLGESYCHRTLAKWIFHIIWDFLKISILSNTTTGVLSSLCWCISSSSLPHLLLVLGSVRLPRVLCLVKSGKEEESTQLLPVIYNPSFRRLTSMQIKPCRRLYWVCLKSYLRETPVFFFSSGTYYHFSTVWTRGEQVIRLNWRPRCALDVFLLRWNAKKKKKFNLSVLFFFGCFHCEWSALTSSRRVSIFCMSLDAEHLRYLPRQRSHSFLLSGKSWTKCLIRAFAVQTAQSALCVTAIINAFQVERIRQKSIWLCLKNANWRWGRRWGKEETPNIRFNV